MLPDPMIILCPDLLDIEPLFAFLSEKGVTWGGLKTPLWEVEIDFARYAERKHDVLCFSLENGRLGYCYEKWYREHDQYRRYPFVHAEELLLPFAEEDPITGLTDLL